MPLSRRSFLTLSGAGLLAARTARASGPTAGRKFVFVLCPGGWDPTMVFAPVFNDDIDRFPTDELAQIGDLSFVDCPTRPSVRSLLEQYGPQVAFINGIEVPSVAHDVCTRWVLTGESRGVRDDWVSILAGRDPNNLLVPNLHLSGPIFPNDYASASVRVGSDGQLVGLLDGTSLSQADLVTTPHSSGAHALENALLAKRLARWEASRGGAQAARYAEMERLAQSRAESLLPHADMLRGDTSDLAPALSIAASSIASGLSRTAIVAYGLGGNGQWDTHSHNDSQDMMFEELFSSLGGLLAELSSTPGESEATLLDETVVVVLSEMGRTPQKNGAGGKDHWTWTSALLIGGGIQGGRAFGEFDADMLGRPLDLASGEVSSSGVSMLPGHVGATILALADVDPGDYMSPEEGEPIAALLP